MKKILTICTALMFFLSSVAAQVKWNELSPMQVLSQDEYLALIEENREQLLGAVYDMSYKNVTVCFLKDEPDYTVPKGKSKGPRMLVCLDAKTDNGAVFFYAVCADSLQENPALEIRYNKFGFCMQTLDSKGRNHLLYTGILVDDIGFYPLGTVVIGTGAYENSFDCIIKEAPFYFWDKTSKKVMCFYSNGAVLSKSNIKLENPLFAFSSESRGQEYRKLYLMDLDPKTKEALPGKIWLCTDCNFVKLESPQQE